MNVHSEFFHTESEALAFVRGVELVHDCDMAACGPRLQPGLEDGEENAWAVAVHDKRPVGTDGEPFADPLSVGRVVLPGVDPGTDVCPLCRSTEWETQANESAGTVLDDASECDTCAAVWRDAEMDQISEYWNRVEPGGTVPSGQCPTCGALCYPKRDTHTEGDQ